MRKIASAMLAAVLTAVLTLTLAACGKNDNQPPAGPGAGGSAQPQQSGRLAAIKKAGKIVLGTSAEYAPYEFHKNIGGQDQIVGFDINIAKEAAKDLGVRLQIKDMEFANLLTEIKLGSVDFVIAGMTPDEQRRKSVDFSKNYYEATQAVFVRAEDKNRYQTIKDLEQKSIGVQLGSTQEKIAKAIPGAKVKSLGKTTELVLELKSKKVDALIAELPVAQGYVTKNRDLALTPIVPNYASGGSAVAVNKGEPALLSAIQKTLDRLQAEGTIDRWVAEMTELAER